MNKTQIAENLAEKAGISRAKALSIVDSLVGSIGDALVSGDRVTISGFGVFRTSLRRSFVGINPRTKEVMNIPSRRIAVFKVGKGLKEALNSE